jgi:hypothetical protein
VEFLTAPLATSGREGTAVEFLTTPLATSGREGTAVEFLTAPLATPGRESTAVEFLTRGIRHVSGHETTVMEILSFNMLRDADQLCAARASQPPHG